MARVPRLGRLELLGVAAAAALFFHLVMLRDGTFFYPFHKATTGPLLDEGARVAAGEVPYRDFAPRVGPGILYFNAALVRSFGHRLDVMAAAGLAVGCALAAALHSLSRAVVRGPWRFAPAAVFVLVVYPYADLGGPRWPALLMALLAARMLMAHPPGPLAAVAAGVAGGTAAVFTPLVGLAAGAGLVLHLALERPPRWAQRILLLALGGLASAGVPAVLLAARAGPAALVSGWWAGAFAGTHSIHLLGRWRPLDCAYLIVTLAGLAAGARWLRQDGVRGDGLAAERLAVRAGLLLLMASVAGDLEPYTLAVHGMLLSVAAAAAAEAAGGGTAAERRSLSWARRTVAAVLAFCTLYGAASLVVWRQWMLPVVRQRFRAGEAWLGAPNAELAWLESSTHPSERVFVFPAGGGSYFLTWTRNATSFPCMIEGEAGEVEQRQALAEIDAAPPAFGIWMGGQRFLPAPGRPRLDVLEQGIFRRYVIERTLPDGTALLRRAGPPVAAAAGRSSADGPAPP